MIGNVGAPFEAQFSSKPDASSDMFAHNLPDMIRHVAEAICHGDRRYRGFVRVTNHDRTLVFVEVNALGWVEKAWATRRAEACPGHVASEADPKVCGHCGTHVDEYRDEPEDQP